MIHARCLLLIAQKAATDPVSAVFGVLIDVFGAHPRFGAACADALRRCPKEGAVVASCLVWSETRAAFASDAEFLRAMQALDISLLPSTEAAATLAGAVHKRHRAAGGKRERVVADFLIGAHAATQCDRLLIDARPSYYRGYFKGLVVVEPS